MTSKLWTKEEIDILKNNRDKSAKDLQLLLHRTINSITVERSRIGLQRKYHFTELYKNMKICPKCKRKLPATNEYFCRCKNYEDGLNYYCKECTTKQQKIYYQKNRKQILKQDKDYRERNKEKIKKNKAKYYLDNKEKIDKRNKKHRQNHKEETKETHRIYYQKNKEKLRKQRKEYNQKSEVKERKNKCKRLRRKTDPQYKLDGNISRVIVKSIKQNKNNRHWENLVGYTLNNLKNHLEKQFNEKMNWGNYGSYWHLDHIIPKSWYIYTKPEDIGFKMCWGLENLQPLKAKDNWSKGNLINYFNQLKKDSGML